MQRRLGLQQLFSARSAVRCRPYQQRAPLQQSFRTTPFQRRRPQKIHSSRLIHTQRSTIASSSPSQTLQAFRRSARKHSSHNYGRRCNSSTSTEAQPTSLKERLKKMTREYGWTAVGVYLALSALDFPFCFLAVRLIGTETIGHYEHIVVGTVKGWLKWPLQGTGMMEMVADEAVEKGAGGKELERVEQEQGNKRILELEEKSGEEESGQVAIYDHGYREAEKANQGEDATLWTQLVLAYAVHKSFIFIRIPLTAAVLPTVVKTLRGWGYNIGKMPVRKAVIGAGVNTKGSGV